MRNSFLHISGYVCDGEMLFGLCDNLNIYKESPFLENVCHDEEIRSSGLPYLLFSSLLQCLFIQVIVFWHMRLLF